MSDKMKEFKKLTSDAERWQWVIDNKDGDYLIMLDNDDTFLEIGEEYESFDNYLGWSDGIFTLLDVLGIKCDGV